jgi:hypothetical protein
VWRPGGINNMAGKVNDMILLEDSAEHDGGNLSSVCNGMLYEFI